ncbi:hypothetical protein [[Enterobacter] lignolyticus]|uniref:DNA utilization protein HofO C-terminal domain-containing protein n=1 Tax=[Enterobacter] lignolyticus TaxID=1334193 RepID=A0A806XI90_9ENTR|nr:hypothetical protein [[Enterobacter] lignolyticus]ALR78419.1 hypothetical protein AO703_19710 [[Enterobacter] lignolyticus]
MRHLPERWCCCSAKIRWGTWCAVLLLAYGAGEVAVSRDIPSVNAQPTLRAQWRKTLALSSPRNEKAPERTLAFSPVDFQMPGSTLLRWLPDDSGGELALGVEWPVVPDIFTALTRRGMAVKSFRLAPENGRLQLTLRLESLDRG